mmetsp:Transcript_30359/g.31605  ORF Transcript_30359/g.31605 Transcript_30359/m.31605 type:complete len:214 (-) Transcript_30359:45-686(-)
MSQEEKENTGIIETNTAPNLSMNNDNSLFEIHPVQLSQSPKKNFIEHKFEKYKNSDIIMEKTEERRKEKGTNIDLSGIKIVLMKDRIPVIESQTISLSELLLINLDKLLYQNTYSFSTEYEFQLKSDFLSSKYYHESLKCRCQIDFLLNPRTKLSVLRKLRRIFAANVIQNNHYSKELNKIVESFCIGAKDEIYGCLENRQSRKNCCNDCRIF